MRNSNFKTQRNGLLVSFLMLLASGLNLIPQVPAQVASGGGFTLEKSVVATGGGSSSGAGFSVTGSSGQNAAGTQTFSGVFFQVGGFWAPDPLAPTAALVSVGGTVATSNGSGIRNVIVTLTDTDGRIRRAVTGSFGSYRFTDVEVGRTYVLRVQAKKHSFTSSTMIISVNEELVELNFTADD